MNKCQLNVSMNHKRDLYYNYNFELESLSTGIVQISDNRSVITVNYWLAKKNVNPCITDIAPRPSNY